MSKLNLVSPNTRDTNTGIARSFLSGMTEEEKKETIKMSKTIQSKLQHKDELSKKTPTQYQGEDVGATEAFKYLFPEPSIEKKVPLSLLDPAPNDWNFFGRPDKEQYELLIDSIICHGLLNPVTLWKRPNGRYMILSGHTRASVFQACRDASDEDKKKDWEEIPAKIYEENEIKEDTAQQIIIEANMCQRAKESVRLRVRCIGRLAEIGRRQHRYGDANDKVTQRIAERWGIKRSSVFFYQRVAKFLLPVLADRFSDHLMSRTVADYLCRLSTEVQQHMIDSGYIARLTIAYARQFKEGMTKADIDRIFSESSPERHTYNMQLSFAKPKDSEILGICVSKKDLAKCREIVLKALSNADISEETKQMLKTQFSD